MFPIKHPISVIEHHVMRVYRSTSEIKDGDGEGSRTEADQIVLWFTSGCGIERSGLFIV